MNVCSGPLVATFVGAVPEQHITDTGMYNYYYIYYIFN